jgi:hypothetical protein
MDFKPELCDAVSPNCLFSAHFFGVTKGKKGACEVQHKGPKSTAAPEVDEENAGSQETEI